MGGQESKQYDMPVSVIDKMVDRKTIRDCYLKAEKSIEENIKLLSTEMPSEVHTPRGGLFAVEDIPKGQMFLYEDEIFSNAVNPLFKCEYASKVREAFTNESMYDGLKYAADNYYNSGLEYRVNISVARFSTGEKVYITNRDIKKGEDIQIIGLLPCMFGIFSEFITKNNVAGYIRFLRYSLENISNDQINGSSKELMQDHLEDVLDKIKDL
jgi:hypothetical protein